MKWKRILTLPLTLAIIFTLNNSSLTVLAAVQQPEVITGNGEVFLKDGTFNSASIGNPTGITIDKDGILYVTDTNNQVIRKITENKVSTFAGKQGIIDQYGQAMGGYRDGDQKDAYFNTPYDILPYKDGLVVSDRDNNLIRYLVNAKVYTLAGGFSPGFVNGREEAVRFNAPSGLAVDENGNLYIADTLNHVIRKYGQNGEVTTFAGGKGGYKNGSLTSAEFYQPTGLCYANGGLYVVDTGNQRIRLIKNNKVTTIAGNGSKIKDTVGGGYAGGLKNGKASTSQFSNPSDIAVTKDGTIYVSDTSNGRIRKMKDNTVSTVLYLKKGSNQTYPVAPSGLTIKDNKLYIVDNFANTIYTIKID